MRVEAALAPGATAAALIAALADEPGPVATVGHQPDCSEIALAVLGPRSRLSRLRAWPSWSSPGERRAGSCGARASQELRRGRGRRRHQLHRRAGRGVRPARPERRRQDDDGRDPRGLPHPRRRRRDRARGRPRERRLGAARADRRRPPGVGHAGRADGARGAPDVRRVLREAARHRRGDRARRPRGEVRRAGKDALGRAETPARPRHRTRRRPRAPVPRRADHRFRSGRAPHGLGARALTARARQDDSPDDALPRRGAAARRPGGGDPRGPDRQAGLAGRAHRFRPRSRSAIGRTAATS